MQEILREKVKAYIEFINLFGYLTKNPDELVADQLLDLRLKILLIGSPAVVHCFLKWHDSILAGSRIEAFCNLCYEMRRDLFPFEDDEIGIEIMTKFLLGY